MNTSPIITIGTYNEYIEIWGRFISPFKLKQVIEMSHICTIAHDLKIIGASERLINSESVSYYQDEFGSTFAYAFPDESVLIILPDNKRLVCSEKALQRWCKSGRIDNLSI